MTSRFLPYSTRPGRLAAQLFSDIVVVLWTVLWLLVGLAVYDAISTIADVGRQVESGARRHRRRPRLRRPRRPAHSGGRRHGQQAAQLAASQAALDIAGAGHDLDTAASWLAVVLAMAVVAVPILVAVLPWLFLRLRFFRRKLTVTALAATPAGTQLLALRALTNRPPRKLIAVSADPVGGWRREDPATIGALAALELRAAGIAIRGS